jgi:type IV secretion system protein VirB9
VPLPGELTVLLPAGEPVTSVSVARPADWQVIPESSSASFTVRALRPAPDTMMAVQAGPHSYAFVLTASPDLAIPRVVTLVAARNAHAPRGGSIAQIRESSWRLSGNRELWPSAIREDGVKTYLEWRSDQALPAVFALDRLGREEIVNGYMRSGVFTIDRVYDRLVFRIDKAHAAARLRAGRGPR